jgi:hypothetical protein
MAVRQRPAVLAAGLVAFIHDKDRTAFENALLELAGPELETGLAEGRALTLDEAVQLALNATDAG